MKLNNKGFALTSIIYMLIVLFLLLLLLILSNLASRKVVLDKLKYDVKNRFSQGGVVAPLGRTVGEIISFNLTDSGDGLYRSNIELDKFIYKGSNPNNYIFIKEDGINNVLYRIVSFESDGTIKVVRNEKLSSDMEFDSIISDTEGLRKNDDNTFCNYSGTYYGCNVWGNMNNTYYNGQLLNPEFKYRYYLNNTSDVLQEHSNKGTVNSDSSLNQYLNGEWLTSSLSNYIENHSFNVGGVYYYSEYTGGDKGILKETEEEKSYIWNGKVGLLNITEYVQSSNNSLCTSVWSNYFYNPENEINKSSGEWPCKYDNYNYIEGTHQWSLSPYSSIRYNVWLFDSNGYFSTNAASNAYGIRPAFYLKAGTIFTGNGTFDDPYIIVGM